MTNRNERPVLLSVLCILTWVGSAFTFIGLLLLQWLVSSLKSKVSLTQDEKDILLDIRDDELLDVFGAGFRELVSTIISLVLHFSELILIRILGVLMVFVGSLLMWRMKKAGFLLFLAGKVTIILGILVFFRETGFAIQLISYTVIASILFGSLYSINLKYMKE